MRFLYKRPKVELVYEELTDVMDVKIGRASCRERV
jgi:hypothetical protein